MISPLTPSTMGEGWGEVGSTRRGRGLLKLDKHQHYVVDFYCHKHKLAIELDGEVHSSEDRQTYDKKRTDYLNSVGVTVLRFENFEVFQYPTRTLDEIRKHLK